MVTKGGTARVVTAAMRNGATRHHPHVGHTDWLVSVVHKKNIR